MKVFLQKRESQIPINRYALENQNLQSQDRMSPNELPRDFKVRIFIFYSFAKDEKEEEESTEKRRVAF